MKIRAIVTVETLIESDIVVPGNDDLGLKLCLVQPLYGL